MKEEAKAGTFKQKFGIEDVPRAIKKKNKTEQPRPYKNVPDPKPYKWETPRDFLRRVSRTTQNSLKEAHYEAKYNVDILKEESGEVKILKRTDSKGTPVQSRIVKLNAKKKLKKEKKQKMREEEQETDNRIYKKDFVKFGEVCHRPPELKVIRKVNKSLEEIARPGRKNLLLNSLLKS